MKKANPFQIGVALALALCVAACGKSEVAPEGDTPGGQTPAEEGQYDRFEVAIDPSIGGVGSKVYMNNRTAWWESGDYIMVNGCRYIIGKEGNAWVATRDPSATTQVYPIYGHFYCCYVGDGDGTVPLDSVSYTYSNVNFKAGEADIPLAAKTNSNSVLFEPCCVVLYMEFEDGEDQNTKGTITFSYDRAADNMIVTSGKVDPASGSIVSGDPFAGDGDEDSPMVSFEVSGGHAYVVLPIVGNSVTINSFEVTTEGSGLWEQTNGNPIVMQKGRVYSMSFPHAK